MNEVEEEIKKYEQRVANLKRILATPDAMVTCPQCGTTRIKTDWDKEPYLCSSCRLANEAALRREDLEKAIMGAVVTDFSVEGTFEVSEITLEKGGKKYRVKRGYSENIDIEATEYEN